jgi:uncharacterized protein involved in exopolysaccharide biosynthesis
MYLRYTSPVYESSSSIKLEIKQKANLLGISDPTADGMANMSGRIELIRSKLIYDEVISAMDLSMSYFAYGRSRIKNEERFLNSPFRVEAVRLSPAAYDKPFDLTIQDGSEFRTRLYRRRKRAFAYGHLSATPSKPATSN